MAKHRSDLTKAHSAFDFDVVSDPPRPFNVRRDVPAETPGQAPAETPAKPTAGAAKDAASPHSATGFDCGKP
jgi:hypothetical protein